MRAIPPRSVAVAKGDHAWRGRTLLALALVGLAILAAAAANLDWSLPRWSPRLLAQPRQDGILPMVAAGDFATPAVPTIPDWSLHWIRQLQRLHLYTGDTEAVAELMPVAENVLRWFDRFAAEDGLVADVPGWVLIDWSPVQVAGRSAALNALLARAFLDVAELSDALGEERV